MRRRPIETDQQLDGRRRELAYVVLGDKGAPPVPVTAVNESAIKVG
jgi:hypothetical protein